jgi:hypothetical protein
MSALQALKHHQATGQFLLPKAAPDGQSREAEKAALLDAVEKPLGQVAAMQARRAGSGAAVVLLTRPQLKKTLLLVLEQDSTLLEAIYGKYTGLVAGLT